LDLGKTTKGTVVKRPSSTIKSPYVADVQIPKHSELVLAHAPALDVGGLCSPGSTVLMKTRPPGGKTSHSIEIVFGDAPNGEQGGILVGAHPRLGEALAEEVLRRGLLEETLGFGAVTAPTVSGKKSPRKKKRDDDGAPFAPGTYLKKQITYGDSRFDFELTKVEEGSATDTLHQMALIEVKNVVCADYFTEHAPEKKGNNHCVLISSEDDESKYQRTAIFPWGRVGQSVEGEERKVVSARAIKHVRTLADVGARETHIQPVVLFVVNRSDCENVRACHEACPVFAEELAKAAKRGVQVVAFRVRWCEDGKAYFDGALPVDLEQKQNSE
jgi:DNA-binding sugar fermentation-stimulating protein